MEIRSQNKLIVSLAAILLTSLLTGCIGSESEGEDIGLKIESMVYDACELIEANGPGSFDDFRIQGGEWWEGDIYVFVWRTDGLRVVYPPDPEGEGENMLSLVDVDDNPIGMLFIDTAVNEPYEGWVEYVWPRPSSEEPEMKMTFIKRAVYQDVEYLVGSGYYVSDYEV